VDADAHRGVVDDDVLEGDAVLGLDNALADLDTVAIGPETRSSKVTLLSGRAVPGTVL
jgi:hypothetical protein